MAGVPPHQRHVSYVSQTTDLFPHLTVAGNIGFGLAYLKLRRHDRRARVARMAELLGIADLRDRDRTNWPVPGFARAVSLSDFHSDRHEKSAFWFSPAGAACTIQLAS